MSSPAGVTSSPGSGGAAPALPLPLLPSSLAAWAAGGAEAREAGGGEEETKSGGERKSDARASAPPKKAEENGVSLHWPPFPAHKFSLAKQSGSAQTTLNFAGRKATAALFAEEFALPSDLQAKPPKAKKARAAKADGAGAASAAAAAAASSSAGEGKKRVKEAKEGEAEEEEMDIPDDNASSALDSFQQLVSAIRKIPMQQLRPAAAGAAASVDPAVAFAAQAPALQVTALQEVPAVAHFLFLEGKQLYFRPVEPARLEAMLLSPDELSNEALCSELLSKLIYCTRVAWPKGLKKKLEMMQHGQRVFDIQMLSEFLFWLVQLWIEQWARKCKRDEDKRKNKHDTGGAEEEEEGEEGAEEKEGGGDGRRKKRTYNRKRAAAAQSDSDSDGDEEENEEEREAYQLHTVPERKWIIDTQALCNNINPFAPDPRPVATPAPASEDSAAAAAPVSEAAASSAPAGASPMDTDAASADAASADAASTTAAPAATAASASPAAPAVLSVSPDAVTPVVLSSEGHKMLHEVPLSFRAALLQALCDFQLALNPGVIENVRKEREAKELRLPYLGRDCHGKRYFFSGFNDYRIYVQGTVQHVPIGQSAEEAEAAEAKKKEKEEWQRGVPAKVQAQVAVLLAKQAKQKAEEAAQAKAEKEAAKASKKKGSAALAIDEDAPLSLLAAKTSKKAAASAAAAADAIDEDAPLSLLTKPAKAAPVSSLSSLPSPPGASTAAASSASAAAASEASTTAAASSSGATAAPASSASEAATAAADNSSDLPFKIKEAEVVRERFLYFEHPPPPPFALLTTSASEVKALLARLKATPHPRNVALRHEIQTVLSELEEGRGRVIAEVETRRGKKEPTAPKRMSDRLVTQELQREEQEKLRALQFLEDARNRDTRRNRWLDEQAQRCVTKLRKSYEKLMGIVREKKKEDSSSEEEEEEEEEEESDSDSASASASRSEATADEDNNRRTRPRKASAASQKAEARARSGARTTRNQGKSSGVSMSDGQSETESEEEEEAYEPDEDDPGCAICQLVVPPEDGSNPIMFCEKCDRQYCLKCSNRDRVPSGKFFCDECVSKYPRLR